MTLGRWIAVLAVLAVAAGGLLVLNRRHRLAGATSADQVISQPGRVGTVGREAVVVLDSSAVEAMGITVERVGGAKGGGEIRLPAQVSVDSSRIARVRAPVSGRLAAAGAGWPSFGTSVAEGQQLGRVSDALPLASPLGGTVTLVGAQVGEQVIAGQVLLEITDRSQPLARIPWTEDAPQPPPPNLTVTSADPREHRVMADLVGPAPQADPGTRSPVMLYRLRQAWPALTPGTAVMAVIPRSAPRGALLVPAAAAVQWEGLMWVFVEREPGRFARVRLPSDRPVASGWVVSEGIVAGDRVVVRGAEQLLSEEFRAQAKVGEEVGE